MTHLSWAEEEVTESLAGSLLAVASLGDHLGPEQAADLRIAVLAKIGDRERNLIRRLAEEIPND